MHVFFDDIWREKNLLVWGTWRMIELKGERDEMRLYCCEKDECQMSWVAKEGGTHMALRKRAKKGKLFRNNMKKGKKCVKKKRKKRNILREQWERMSWWEENENPTKLGFCFLDTNRLLHHPFISLFQFYFDRDLDANLFKYLDSFIELVYFFKYYHYFYLFIINRKATIIGISVY